MNKLKHPYLLTKRGESIGVKHKNDGEPFISYYNSDGKNSGFLDLIDLVVFLNDHKVVVRIIKIIGARVDTSKLVALLEKHHD